MKKIIEWIKILFGQEETEEYLDEPKYRVVKIEQPKITKNEALGINMVDPCIKYLIEKYKKNDWEVVWESRDEDCHSWSDQMVYEKAQSMLKNDLKYKKSIHIMNVSENGPCIPVKVTNDPAKDKFIEIANRKIKENLEKKWIYPTKF